MLTEISIFGAFGATLVVASLVWWIGLLSVSWELRAQESSMVTDLARIEVQLDSVLTLGDLVFYGHNQDFLLPAMQTHVEHLGNTLRRLEGQSTLELSRSLDWKALGEDSRELERLLNARAEIDSPSEMNALNEEYESLSGKLVGDLVNAERTFAEWQTSLKHSHSERQGRLVMLSSALMLLYLAGTVLLWLRAHRHIAMPLGRIRHEAARAMEGTGRYVHQTDGAAEVVQVSEQLNALITHLESQVAQRTQSLEIQTVRLELEMEERVQVDALLRQRNEALESAMERLAEAQQELLKKARMEALGEMAGGVAHDFNNTLTPILTSSDMLATSLDTMSPKMIHDAAMLIRIAAQDGAELVRRLRASYVGVDEIPSEKFEITAVLRSAVRLCETELRALGEAGLPVPELIIEDAATPAFTSGNRSQLRQALVNLIVNAMHASPSGGRIFVRAIPCVQDEVLLEVRDEGTGMPPEVLERCLDPLFTTKGEKGTGLGLMNVASTVRDHHGKLEISSEVGKGTTMSIFLPQVEKPEVIEPDPFPQLDTDPHANAAPPGVEKASDLVLLVDDDRTVVRALKRVIRHAGFRVIAFTSPEAALASLDNETPMFVITDYNMPGMSGCELALAIRAGGNHLPVMVMTGQEPTEELENQIAQGIVESMLSKPFEMGELLSRLEALKS